MIKLLYVRCPDIRRKLFAFDVFQLSRKAAVNILRISLSSFVRFDLVFARFAGYNQPPPYPPPSPAAGKEYTTLQLFRHIVDLL